MFKHNKRSVRNAAQLCNCGLNHDNLKLYWFHTSDTTDAVCADCGHPDTRMFLGDEYGNAHVDAKFDMIWQSSDRAEKKSVVVAGEVVAVTDTPATPKAPQNDATAVGEALLNILGGASIDESALIGKAVEAAKAAVAELDRPKVVVFQRADGDENVVESAHPMLDRISKVMLSGENVFLEGPAGSGKTSIAAQVAELFGLEFSAVSVHVQMTQASLFGFKNAHGEYVRTDVRERFEHGGVLLLDEIDAANPGIMVAANALIENKRIGFPDGMVERHKDFFVIVAANTTGRGANRTYNGRQKLDEATLDRFAMVRVDYLPEFERSLCLATGCDAATVDKVLKFIRGIRDRVDSSGVQFVVSTRASRGMCRLLRDGAFTWDEAVDMRVRKGMDDATWKKVAA